MAQKSSNAEVNESAEVPSSIGINGVSIGSEGPVAKINTDVLIVGAGPAGASLACFLAQNGIQGIMVCQTPSTAPTPRAHICNMAAMECLRELGMEDEVKRLGVPHREHGFYRYCRSMAGEEWSRSYAFGADPRREAEYFDASPCQHVDCPQTLLEPVLVRYAMQTGFQCRFSTKYLSFVEAADGTITTTLLDLMTNTKLQVVSRYLAGADGGKSSIVQQIDLPFHDTGGGGIATNILIEADLSELVRYTPAVLNATFQPDTQLDDWAIMGFCRLIRPFNEWLCILLAAPHVTRITATPVQMLAKVKQIIGDDSIPVRIKDISYWKVNETYATAYTNPSSAKNVFCLGDAVHRHPPCNAFGSNTCIQDAYNLAWKMAYTIKGLAGPRLLDTYSAERAPTGKRIVTRANDSMRHHFSIWAALGLGPDSTVESRKQVLADLRSDSKIGRQRRKQLREAIEGIKMEVQTVGAEMNQDYSHAGAVYTGDEVGPPPLREKESDLDHFACTYPGSRLPHAWLNKARPREPVSTQDLAGHGRWTIFTGIGGDVWKDVAAAVARDLKLDIAVHVIGWRQEWEDPLFQWETARGVEEDGAVLARPDRFVAWRSNTREGATAEKLGTVLRRCLGWEEA